MKFDVLIVSGSVKCADRSGTGPASSIPVSIPCWQRAVLGIIGTL